MEGAVDLPRMDNSTFLYTLSTFRVSYTYSDEDCLGHRSGRDRFSFQIRPTTSTPHSAKSSCSSISSDTIQTIWVPSTSILGSRRRLGRRSTHPGRVSARNTRQTSASADCRVWKREREESTTRRESRACTLRQRYPSLVHATKCSLPISWISVDLP